MATDKLFPAYVTIDYSSPYGQHVMTRPTLALTSSGIGVPGTFATHAAGSVAADVMVEEFITAMMEVFHEDSTSIAYTIWRIPEIDDDPQPVFSKAFPVAGGNADPDTTGSKAWVNTLMYRTTEFGLAKILLMEAWRSGNQGKSTGALTGAYAALSTIFQDPDNGWAGQDNGRPAVYMSANWKPNDRLIRGYKGDW